MTSLSLTIGVGILLCAAYHVQSKREFTVDIDRIKLDSDQEFLNITGNIRKTDKGVSVVDISVDLHHNVHATVFIESEIFIKNNGVYNSFLKGSPMDICAFFANPQLNPLLSMIMNTMNKYGNKMTSCPIGKLRYDIIGFQMDTSTLPSFIPIGDYRIEVKTSRQTEAGAPLKMLMLFDCDSRVYYK